jgi:hypothetical protein
METVSQPTNVDRIKFGLVPSVPARMDSLALMEFATRCVPLMPIGSTTNASASPDSLTPTQQDSASNSPLPAEPTMSGRMETVSVPVLLVSSTICA